MMSRFGSDIETENDDSTKGLTLLLVEDDKLSCEIVLVRLSNLFKNIVVATDGAEGLRCFQEHAPDIVLSDQVMPTFSGMEMLRLIRKIDPDVPLILMTSSMDNETLLEAINLGINRFIPKPFEYDVLVRVIDDMIRELTNKRQLEQCRLQEIDLLRYRDSYNSMQQEAACRKERHVARHDLRNQVITGTDGIRWGISVANAPKDIMCGDGYTIRNLSDGRQLIFVVDAMGSGLSASLSALLVTSFCNYKVDRLHNNPDFNLKFLINCFQDYLSGILFEEEVLSCGFFLVDLISLELEMAMFGLPPLLVRKLNGSVKRISGANPPLSIYGTASEITSISLNDVADVMVMTDGITDASLSEGSTYRERLEDDYHNSPTLAALLSLFSFHSDTGILDDLTMLHLQRLDLPAVWSWSREPSVQLNCLKETVVDFLEDLNREVVLEEAEQSELETILNEALVNALEHGCLRISDSEKNRLVTLGEYENYLAHQNAGLNAHIMLSASLWQGAKRPLLVIEVLDNGPGLTVEEFSSISKGSGLSKIWRRCDCFFVGGPGCRLLLLKTIEGGEEYAS